TAVPAPASPSLSQDQGENIAGVGAEILDVAEGIRSLVQLWDEGTTRRTGNAGEPTAAAPRTTTRTSLAAPSSATGLAGHGNMTANSTGDGHGLLGTGQAEASLPMPTGPPPAWNRTRALLQKPAAAPPGSASFPFSPEGQESATLPQARAGGGVASEKRGGVSPTASVLDWREPQTDISVHAGIPAQLAGSLDNWLSHYVAHSNQSLSYGNSTRRSLKNNSSQSVQSTDPSTMHFGIAVADLNRNHNDAVSNTNATNSVDFFSARLASFFPGLTLTAGRCLPFPADLPYCNNLGIKHFRLPNYFHHGSDVEIRAALHEWEGLLTSRCHRYLEWFFCLLLVPGCNASIPITPPPCWGFCEAVRDLCWIHLKDGRLPMSCDSLPAEDAGYSCVFVNVSAGNI
ncbi:Collagen alpha-1(XVIII) chain, partial [Chelonia mydas]